MSGFILIAFFASLILVPLASILWMCSCWNKFKTSIPFSAEYDKRKRRLIVSFVVLGIVMTIFAVIMALYGIFVFFA